MHIAATIALDVPAFSAGTAPIAARRPAMTRNVWGSDREGRASTIATATLALALLPVVMGAFAHALIG